MLRLIKGEDRFRYVDCTSEIPFLSYKQRRINKWRSRLFKKLSHPFKIDDPKFEKATNQGITVLKSEVKWANLKLKR